MRSAIDSKIIRRAWIEAKAFYVANRNAVCRDELVTFEEYEYRKILFRSKMRISEGHTSLSLGERFEKVTLVS